MKRLSLLALAFAMTACETLPPPLPPVDDPEQAWKVRQHLLADTLPWSLTGRISIKTEDDSWQASLRWHESAGKYEIWLSGPLGQGTVQIEGSEQGAILRTDDEHYVAKNAETLLHEQLGWYIPVSGLHAWILGLPEPGMPARQEVDDRGRLSRLVQSGWEISYRKYMRVNDLELPRKVFLKNSRLDVRVVIDQWNLEQ